MKKVLAFFISLMFLVSMVYSYAIKLKSPKAGEEWCTGNTYAIKWTSTPPFNANIKISLFKLGVKVEDIVDSTSNSGSYNWMIPDNIPKDDQYRVRVEVINEPIFGNSKKFTLSSCQNRPDLVIEEMWVIPKPRYMGKKLTFNARVNNARSHWLARSSKAKLKIFRPRGLTQLTIPLQVAGFSYLNKVPQTLTYSFVPKTWGIYKFVLELDVEDVVEEFDENNNKRTHYSAISPLLDLIVCLTWGKRPRLCKNTTITAWVKNIGTAESPPCVLHFYMKERGTKTYPIPRLQPDQVHTPITRRAKYCDPTKLGWKTMSANIDQENEVKELSENNNRVSTRYKVVRHEPPFPVAEFDESGIILTVKCSDGTTKMKGDLNRKK